MIVLRPYQVETLEKIREAERRGVRRQLVALPTGTGKTVDLLSVNRRSRRPGPGAGAS